MANAAPRRRRSTARLAAALLLTIAAIAGLGYAADRAGWLRFSVDPFAEARAAYDRGDFATTARLARERLRATPNDPDGLRYLARAAMKQGRDDVAQGIYQNLTIEKMQSDDFLLLASSLSRMDQSDGARKLLREAVARDPENPEVLAELARLLALVDQLDEARGLAARLARVPGWERQGWVLLGVLHHELGRQDQAAEALGSALDAPPSEHSTQPDAALRKLRSRALLAEGQPDAALETLAPLLSASESNDPEVPWLASRAHLQLGAYEQANADAARAGSYLDDQPLAHEPAPYVGALACAPCHKEIHGSQQSSHHGATFALGPDMTRWTLPDTPQADRFNKEVHHTIADTSDGPRFTTTRDGVSASGLIQYVFGSGDRGATPVGRGDDGEPIEFRLSSYGSEQGWDVTSGHTPMPANAADGGARAYLGRKLDVDGLRRCFECHTTDTHSAIVQRPPTAADHGIGCERCHGPGGHHVQAMNAAPRFADLAIARPRLATPTDLTTRLCGRCHSPRGATAKKDEPASIRFQADTLTWSRCYTESQGALGCTSCHGPHSNTEPTPAYFESKCLACHSPSGAASPATPSPAASDEDTARPIHLPESVARVVCPVNPVDGCITCHMPVRDDIIPLTPFTDHWIRVHDNEKR